MTTYLTTDTELTSIANAIRTKGDTSVSLAYPSGFISAINAITTAGSDISGPVLQSKSVTITPNTTTQSETVSPDTGYDGLSDVTITVPAVAAGTAGTPSIEYIYETPNTVTLYPKVINTSGYITGSTITGNTMTITAGSLTTGTLTITTNGTHNVTNYESATVSVSQWKLIASTAVTTATTTTTATSILSWATGKTELWNKAKIVYIRVRDSQGTRNNYFVGSDTFAINYQHANSSTTALSVLGRAMHRCSSAGAYTTYWAGSTTGYGIYPYSITNAGVVNIYRRYSSSYSLTIDGTYNIQVFTLDWPTGYGGPFG